jgi:molybdopterin/thiamine biosynthesis adenylyltransferase
VYRETFTAEADYSRLQETPFSRSRLRQLSCVVVGAGALGNEVARILGLLGTSKVTVVDPDVVETTNLPRSIFFWGEKAVGRNKASALAEAATGIFPQTCWAATQCEIADVGFQCLSDAALLFSCVDSDLARLEIAYISKKLRIPTADGGLGRQNYSHGRVTYFPGAANQACYGCMLSPTKRCELLELWQATLRPCGPGSEGIENELISTPTMAGIVGAIQVEVGLRSLFQAENGTPASSRSLEIQIHPARRMEDFAIPVSTDCPFHRDETYLTALPRPDATFEELLNTARADTVLLDWPICVEARCMDCEKLWSPMQRLAALRRRGGCPVCGARKILELETIRAIGRDSSWLKVTPSALQLPADHLYSVLRRSDIS